MRPEEYIKQKREELRGSLIDILISIFIVASAIMSMYSTVALVTEGRV